MGEDLVIYNGWALTMNERREVIPNAVLEIRGGRIVSLKSQPDFLPAKGSNAIDAKRGLILPGLINCHAHAPMALLRGLAEDLPLDRWLGEVIFPSERKWGSPEFVYEGTLLACAEMIRTGTTFFNDMYYFEEEVARASHDAGLRAVCGQTIIEVDVLGGQAAEVLDKFDGYLDAVKKFPRVLPAIAPHAIYHVGTALFEKLIDYSARRNLRVHFHLSETAAEVEACRREFGKSPVEYLDGLGLWKTPVISAHATCLSDNDVEILGRRRARISHNPETNLKLGSKISPVVALRRAGAIVGLGTDGSCSNNNLDLFQEADTAAKLQSFLYGPGELKAEEVVRMLTIDGARVLGVADEVGSLEVGKFGDVIVVDVRNVHSVPLYNPYGHLVYSATGADVFHTVVGGKILMKDRVLLSIDEKNILDVAARWGKKIGGDNFYPPR